MLRAGIEEVHKTGTAVELGEKDGCIGLRFRSFDPIKAGSETAVIATTFPKNPTAIAAHPHGCRAFLQLLERDL